MTQKEKAEAYDKALERARAINNGKDVDVESGTTTCEYIFPELKEENNDERIKKNCIHFLELQKQHHAATFAIEECITWLEKQGKEECALKSFKDKDVHKFMQYIEKQAKAYEFNLPNRSYDIYAFAKDILVWLEKQGEQKPCMIQWKGDNLKEVIGFTGKDKNFEKWFKSFEEYERYVHEHNDIFKLFNENGSHYEIPVGAWIVKTPDGYNIASNAVLKQKSADKIEPTFNVNDWVVNKFGDSWHIDSLDKKNYQVSDGKGNYNYFPISKQDEMHLWTIQDAKDGDVLVCDINKAEIGGNVEKLPNIVSTIFNFKKLINSRDYIHSYCHLYDKRFLGLQSTMYYNSFVYNISPATKEQRDTLIKAMNDAGYELDIEKKELKKNVRVQ